MSINLQFVGDSETVLRYRAAKEKTTINTIIARAIAIYDAVAEAKKIVVFDNAGYGQEVIIDRSKDQPYE